jgi:hypothetical protein
MVPRFVFGGMKPSGSSSVVPPVYYPEGITSFSPATVPWRRHGYAGLTTTHDLNAEGVGSDSSAGLQPRWG